MLGDVQQAVDAAIISTSNRWTTTGGGSASSSFPPSICLCVCVCVCVCSSQLALVYRLRWYALRRKWVGVTGGVERKISFVCTTIAFRSRHGMASHTRHPTQELEQNVRVCVCANSEAERNFYCTVGSVQKCTGRT